MPRIGRIVLANYPHHIVQRRHDRNEVFIDDRDYSYYLESLKEFKEMFGVKVYAYCLMTNHVHLLLEPSERSGVGQLMKRLAGRQTRYRNRLENRRGTLWEGRYKSSIVDADEYQISCVRYIEMNPVRTGMVVGPKQYKWSSCRERSSEAANTLLDKLPFDCHEYDPFLRNSIPHGEMELIKGSVQSNHITGSTLFCKRIEEAIGRRLLRRKPGRPTNAVEEGN